MSIICTDETEVEDEMMSEALKRSPKKIGLALSGGAARGFAHLWVLKVLVESGIPIDMIAGTSAGSFAGAAFAAGMTVDAIVEMARQMSWLKVSRFGYTTRSVLSNMPIKKFVERNFPVQRIEEMPVPFCAVACDLDSGKEFEFRDAGDIATAVRASCAIPGIYAPVEHEGRLLVDGGISTPMPTANLKRMGAEVIIAVDVLSCGSSYFKRPSTVPGVLLQSALTLLKASSEAQHHHANLVIAPDVAHLRPDQLSKLDEFIELGESAAREKLDDIKRLLTD